jgi:hypothetical protein
VSPGFDGRGEGAGVGVAVAAVGTLDLVEVGAALGDFVGEPDSTRVGKSVGPKVGSAVPKARQLG